MHDLEDKIKGYYTMGDIMSSILHSFESADRRTTDLKPVDLAPVDQFHIGEPFAKDGFLFKIKACT